MAQDPYRDRRENLDIRARKVMTCAIGDALTLPDLLVQIPQTEHGRKTAVVPQLGLPLARLGVRFDVVVQ
jgi:hypothetical protein